MKNNKNDIVVVSACLSGVVCRFDGTSKPDAKALELRSGGNALLVCPELLGGLPTPRPACELCQKNGKTYVLDAFGNDYTDEFLLGAQRGLQIAKEKGAKKAYLKSNSPSCGVSAIYDGTFSGKKVSGIGLFAKLLQDNGIEVEESI